MSLRGFLSILCIVLALSAIAPPARAKLDERALARHLYKALQYENLFKLTFKQSYFNFLMNDPHYGKAEGQKAMSMKAKAELSEVVTEVFMEEYKEQIKEQTVDLLIKRFDYEELNQIIMFFSSPVGMKMRDLSGRLTLDFNNIGRAIDDLHNQRMSRDPAFQKAYSAKLHQRIEERLGR